ncbi:hypothetical protein BLNAU_7768 [Blattamonas nauphoetae]|uniref:Uncharacterized protein n=1 Tax=Blattamonas nauphoetae TaxID=2049346 RepID=A0ABQ9Y0G2_9EUKA|nr:hypothetical protein BLNAU_7768 [Blattamonas nauphoetae]
MALEDTTLELGNTGGCPGIYPLIKGVNLDLMHGQDMKGSGADVPTVSIYPVGKKTAENTVALSNVEVLEGNTVVKGNYHRATANISKGLSYTLEVAAGSEVSNLFTFTTIGSHKRSVQTRLTIQSCYLITLSFSKYDRKRRVVHCPTFDGEYCPTRRLDSAVQYRDITEKDMRVEGMVHFGLGSSLDGRLRGSFKSILFPRKTTLAEKRIPTHPQILS